VASAGPKERIEAPCTQAVWISEVVLVDKLTSGPEPISRFDALLKCLGL